MSRLPVVVSLILCANTAAAYDEIRYRPAVSLEKAALPAAVVSDGQRVYVLDSKKSTLLVSDEKGAALESIGRPGAGPGALSSPKGLALGPDGLVYVADTGNSRITVFSGDGKFVRSFSAKGSEEGKLRSPEAVALGGDGRVYVADTGNNRVQIFTAEGIFLSALGPKFSKGFKGKAGKDSSKDADKPQEEMGQLGAPSRVAVDASDFIYVLDGKSERIHKFSPQGRFLKAFDVKGSDFALDEYGFLYILDPDARKVREVAPDGTSLGAFGSKGSGLGQFKEPVHISAAPEGIFWVIDRGLKRLSSVELAGKLKTDLTSPATGPKLLVSGPTRDWAWSAGALAAAVGKTSETAPDVLHAYLPTEGQFVALDANGKAVSRFGKKSGKEPFVTKQSRGFAVSREQGIFVADAGGDKVQHFTSSGGFVANFAQALGFFDSKSKEGRVRSPEGVAISDRGTVFVADAGNQRVDAFQADGTLLYTFGPPVGKLEFSQPVGLAWDSEGFIYVLDRGLKKVVKCEPSGGFVAAWGREDLGGASWRDPAAIAFDGKRYLFILDRETRRVSVLTKDGLWVTDLFSRGEGGPGLKDPVALAVQGDELFVADPGQGKILAFALHPRLAPPQDISATVVQGMVELQWRGRSDPYLARYHVLRSTRAAGPFSRIGDVETPMFRDEAVSSGETYYYRVAAQAKTNDLGVPSLPVSAEVTATSNKPLLEIVEVEMGNIFSANYKYYEKNAAGNLTLQNNSNLPFENVKVTFRLKDFMDFGTDTVLAKVRPQDKVEIVLKAVLNNRILEVTEGTPIQAEFSLTYFQEGRPMVVSLTKPLRIYSRNTITWDRPDRIATFITSNDTPIRDFARQVLTQAPALPAHLAAWGDDSAPVKAMRLWSALGAAGVKFQPAPNNPFEKMAVDPAFPEDYTQFPRETLRTKSGECDDLATLTASLFEAAGIRTALLDYPGHIALMFEVGAGEPYELGLPEESLVAYEGSFWMPLEVTLVGSPFGEANRHALGAYREMERLGKAAVIDPRKAWEIFEPATMPPMAWSPELPKAQEVAQGAEADIKRYVQERYEYLAKLYQGRIAKDAKDDEATAALGVLELEMGRSERAEELFRRALEIDPGQSAALNNLGSLAFLRKDFAKSRELFAKAAEKDSQDPGIWLNLVRVAVKFKETAKAEEFGKKAVALDPGADASVRELIP
ncbi:MAG: tetratricopeptide repeat protein [Elusimicrobia bacterium]|nr:tetratricopeptide repeat protein [Elusimicrobiota bacterium]